MIEKINFLGEGKFTKRDDFVKETLKRILSSKERENPWGKISLYLKKELKNNEPRNMKEFRKRTASEIIKSGYVNSCSDVGIVFATLAREAGIPTMYVESFEKENLLKIPQLISSHTFVDLLLNKKWVPYEPLIGFNGYNLKNSEYVPIARGLDFGKLYLLENGKYKQKPINLDTLLKLKALRNKISKGF